MVGVARKGGQATFPEAPFHEQLCGVRLHWKRLSASILGIHIAAVLLLIPLIPPQMRTAVSTPRVITHQCHVHQLSPVFDAVALLSIHSIQYLEIDSLS